MPGTRNSRLSANDTRGLRPLSLFCRRRSAPPPLSTPSGSLVLDRVSHRLVHRLWCPPELVCTAWTFIRLWRRQVSTPCCARSRSSQTPMPALHDNTATYPFPPPSVSVPTPPHAPTAARGRPNVLAPPSAVHLNPLRVRVRRCHAVWLPAWFVPVAVFSLCVRAFGGLAWSGCSFVFHRSPLAANFVARFPLSAGSEPGLFEVSGLGWGGGVGVEDGLS